MRFALLKDERIEATKGAKGLCPSCGSELIAKCGEIKDIIGRTRRSVMTIGGRMKQSGIVIGRTSFLKSGKR